MTATTFKYRKTAPGIFMVDDAGAYIGTVQEIGSEWWAYPPASGDTSYTRPTREDAAMVLRAHGNALTPPVGIILSAGEHWCDAHDCKVCDGGDREPSELS